MALTVSVEKTMLVEGTLAYSCLAQLWNTFERTHLYTRYFKYLSKRPLKCVLSSKAIYTGFHPLEAFRKYLFIEVELSIILSLYSSDINFMW